MIKVKFIQSKVSYAQAKIDQGLSWASQEAYMSSDPEVVWMSNDQI